MNKVDWTKVDWDKFHAALRERIGELNKIAPGVVVEESPDATLFTVCVRLRNVSVSLSSQKPDWIVVHGDCSIDELSRAQSVIASVDKLASECLKKPKHPFVGRQTRCNGIVDNKWELDVPEATKRVNPPLGGCWARHPSFLGVGLLVELSGVLEFFPGITRGSQIAVNQALADEFNTRPRNNPGVVTGTFSPIFTVSF